MANDIHNEPVPPEIECVRSCLKVILEHWDNVQIVVSRFDADDEGDTDTFAAGSGNWHARMNMIRELIIKREEEVRELTRNSMKDND